MKIGIYGGTFDPPHLGHMESARAAMEALELDKLLFLPTWQPPHKPLAPNSAAPEDRLAMVRLMADGLGPKAEACDLEYERKGKSYTAQTLRLLREQYPEDELWLLMGSDMFLTLQEWREPEVILALAGVAAFARREEDAGEQLGLQAEKLRETYDARIRILVLPEVREVSSTQIRKGENWENLPVQVLGYLLMHGLYGTDRDLKRLTDDELRACSLSMVKAKRIRHIMGTEEEAVRLARRWGADETAARRAGILHDCTKYWSVEEHLRCCEQYGMELDEMERHSEKLLHSKSGACIARHVFGEPEEVCSAICFHTTGRVNMTLLEKILYIADYMEPNRSFEGVEELRRLAYEDLDAAVLKGCEMSITDMEKRGYTIHPNTQQACDWLKGKSNDPGKKKKTRKTKKSKKAAHKR